LAQEFFHSLIQIFNNSSTTKQSDLLQVMLLITKLTHRITVVTIFIQMKSLINQNNYKLLSTILLLTQHLPSHNVPKLQHLSHQMQLMHS